MWASASLRVRLILIYSLLGVTRLIGHNSILLWHSFLRAEKKNNSEKDIFLEDHLYF